MGLINYIRGVFRSMINFQTIQHAEKVDTPLSAEMQSALQEWSNMYRNKASWLSDNVKSLNLPAFISSEIARQILLEANWSITSKDSQGETMTEEGEPQTSPRSEYLAAEFEKLMIVLRQKLEQACAGGGMIIKPYKVGAHLYFDFVMAWDIFPIAFDDEGNLSDVILPDYYTDGKSFYTRLERHTLNYNDDGSIDVLVTQKAYKSSTDQTLGKPISLKEVDKWKDLEEQLIAKNTGGQLFGWFKVAAANTIDVNSCMGASVFAKAKDVIKQADIQYSRMLWEFEGSELAIEVDPTAMLPHKNKRGEPIVPKLNERLFRKLDISRGDDEMYEVFSPAIRDVNLINGLNQILQKVEDLSGLSRGTLSDANNVDARTATELKIVKQRSYATIADNQKALERTLKDVLRVMAYYSTLYGMAPEGEYDVSFDWDDSILVDSETRLSELITLSNLGVVSKQQLREWYFNETPAQAKAALEIVSGEQDADFEREYGPRDE